MTSVKKITASNLMDEQVSEQTLDIQVLVKKASNCLAPVWPIETFIACNPLQGWESQPFEEALMKVWSQRQGVSNQPLLEKVNIQMIKYCSGFFDAGQSRIDMPYREKGFYAAFLKLALFDKQLHGKQKSAITFLRQLPESSEEAIQRCLFRLQVPADKTEDFFVKTLSYLSGWGGFVKWHTEWRDTTSENQAKVSMTDFLAVRLVMTCLIWPDAFQATLAQEPPFLAKGILSKLKANEERYAQTLLGRLLPQVPQVVWHEVRKEAQLVFCIDVRSEPLRRSIESLGNYETFGFAGFFGIPVQIDEFDSNKNKVCCPVLLKPSFKIKETPIHFNQAGLQRYEQGKKIITSSKALYSQLKHNFSTPFALVESLGPWFGMTMALKAFAPDLTKKALAGWRKWISPAPETKVVYELEAQGVEEGLSLQSQIAHAESFLRLIGLTSGFAKMIILCGHGSTTENNPYASALDCGACGGNHGGLNAQLLASILNKRDVRRGLEECGMHIPFDTIFYGALHNTTTDLVTLYQTEAPKALYPELLKQLENDLAEAAVMTMSARDVSFERKHPLKAALKRSQDWSETRPEWGLAKNAAFIVAPRHLTKNISLEGRCFLHSYRFEEDHEGHLLETILTAPMVVAEWINTQYLFSTLDNIVFGSGSKITHNVVGKIGVMQGNGSDLMHGLPLQSVMSTDDEAYHEPQRLLTLVYAPKDSVMRVIQKHAILKTLFLNQWVTLVVIDPESQLPYRLNQHGKFEHELSATESFTGLQT